jgi:transposase
MAPMPAKHFAKHPASADQPSALPDVATLSGLSEPDIRALAASLIEQAQHSAKAFSALQTQIERDQISLRHSQAKIEALTHELRLLRHWKFAPKSEVLHADQRALFEQDREEDIAALEQEIEEINQALQAPPAKAARVRVQPVRTPLPEHLPRVDVHHEPEGFDGTTCPCGCGAPMVRIAEDVSEKLDYVPGSLRVERHVRGRWACRTCERVAQEAMPAHVIDKGLPTEALLAQVVIAKYDDHLPLYRQSEMFARQGVQLSRSTLSQWSGAVGQALLPLAQALKQQVLGCSVLHADESPIQILGQTGQSERGYIWAFSPAQGQDTSAVIYEICDGRSGKHARRFLGRGTAADRDKDKDHLPSGHSPPQRPPWSGHLMVDDYAGYKALFEGGVSLGALGAEDGPSTGERPAPIIELACWAHARRKFHELHIAHQSPMAQQALARIARLYAVESQIREQGLSVEQAQALRELRSLPELQALKTWMVGQLATMTAGTAGARALQYSLKRWEALV